MEISFFVPSTPKSAHAKNLQMYPKDIVLVYFLAELATSNLEAAAVAVVVQFHSMNE